MHVILIIFAETEVRVNFKAVLYDIPAIQINFWKIYPENTHVYWKCDKCLQGLLIAYAYWAPQICEKREFRMKVEKNRSK